MVQPFLLQLQWQQNPRDFLASSLGAACWPYSNVFLICTLVWECKCTHDHSKEPKIISFQTTHFDTCKCVLEGIYGWPCAASPTGLFGWALFPFLNIEMFPILYDASRLHCEDSLTGASIQAALLDPREIVFIRQQGGCLYHHHHRRRHYYFQKGGRPCPDGQGQVPRDQYRLGHTVSKGLSKFNINLSKFC